MEGEIEQNLLNLAMIFNFLAFAIKFKLVEVKKGTMLANLSTSKNKQKI